MFCRLFLPLLRNLCKFHLELPAHFGLNEGAENSLTSSSSNEVLEDESTKRKDFVFFFFLFTLGVLDVASTVPLSTSLLLSSSNPYRTGGRVAVIGFARSAPVFLRISPCGVDFNLREAQAGTKVTSSSLSLSSSPSVDNCGAAAAAAATAAIDLICESSDARETGTRRIVFPFPRGDVAELVLLVVVVAAAVIGTESWRDPSSEKIFALSVSTVLTSSRSDPC